MKTSDRIQLLPGVNGLQREFVRCFSFLPGKEEDCETPMTIGLRLQSSLDVKKTKDAGYYFFSVPIGHLEWGNLVERPLAYDDLEEFARRGRIYWLDPDGTKHPIPVRPDA